MKKVFGLALLLLCSCSKPTPTIEPKITLVKIIGSDNPDSLDYFFSGIADIKTDSIGNLYVLDNISLLVKKFSPEGKYLNVLGKGKGDGPGELRRPNQIGIEGGKIFILDQVLRRLTIFNPNGDIFSIISGLKMMPSRFAVDMKNELIFMVGFSVSYEGPMVHVYRTNKDGNTFVYDTSFVKRYPEIAVTKRTGNTDQIIKGPDGTIFYSQHYPYKILQFSKKGVLINEFEGPEKLSKPPTAKDDLVISNSGCRSLSVLNDSLIVNVVMETNERYYLDIFNNQGSWLCSVDLKNFGIKSIRYMCASSKGDIYLDVKEPYPTIYKYHIEFLNKK